MATAEGFEKRTACLEAGAFNASVGGSFDPGSDLSPVAALDAPRGVWLGAVSVYLARPLGDASATLHFELRARYAGEDSETLVPLTELAQFEGQGGSIWHLSGPRFKGVEVWGRSSGGAVTGTVRFAACPGDAPVPWFSQAGRLV